MCAAMNQVSDLSLAVAVHAAGAMPTLQIKRYNEDRTLNHDIINETLKEYTKQTGTNNVILIASEEDFLDHTFIKLIKDHQVSHIEILSNLAENSSWCYDPRWPLTMKIVRSTTKIMQRSLDSALNLPWVDAYGVKGAESAGFTGQLTVSQMFDLQQQTTPDKSVIPYGGIGTPRQVKEYLDRGAGAVAVGTLFAATNESCLSLAAKQAMVSANSQQLTKFKENNQSALILGNKNDVLDDQSNWNRDASLNLGLTGNGTQGHIYAGASIDHVTQIRSVQEVVDYLTSEL
jgi:NAD(P)H-dependent flavin oxidoreductase YrpB (nitropropane dioxygenase family)